MRVIFILLLFLTIPLFIIGEELPGEEPVPTEEEAPAALFEFEIGDAEVDVMLTGSWSILLTAATGLLIEAGKSVRVLDSMPGFQPGVVFIQEPDITLYLSIMQKYFLEFTYLGNIEDFTGNYILAGYEDPEGELLKHLYIGNKNIGIPPYKYIQIPESGNSSLGMEALLETPKTQHHFLLRYDNNETGQKLFIGKNEVVEHLINPYDIIGGRFFRLPDEEVEDIILFLENPAGQYTDSGNKTYSQAAGEQAVIDSRGGFIYLKEEIQGRVLVYYTKNTLPVGTDNPALGVDALAGEDPDGNIDTTTRERFYFGMGTYMGEDMADRKITLDLPKECLLLWEPGRFSPFEFRSSYPMPGGLDLERWQYNINLVYRGTGTPLENAPATLQYNLLPLEERFTVAHSLDLRESPESLYPLPDPLHKLYGPGASRGAAYPSYEIQLRLEYPVSDYILEPELIPGSVKVLRNGVEDTDIEVDYPSGTLKFNTYVHPEERIEVFYKRQNELLNNGDITFGWGNNISFGENNKLDLAMGLRWNIVPGAFSEEPYSRTGALSASAAYNTKIKNFELKASAGVSYTNPDTTGLFLLDGMEKDETVTEADENTTYPAAPPTLQPAGLTAGNRGRILYKNYRSTDGLGNTVLNSITAEIPVENIYPYATGSKTGPYNVAAGSRNNLVIDFEIDPAKEWVGVQLPFGINRGLQDFSYVNSLLFSFKALDISGDYQVYLQLGEIGEDLDADTNLDEETSEYSMGFNFNDTSNGPVLLIGGGPDGEGNGILNTEDIDGNGFLDPENPANILTLTDPGLLRLSEATTRNTQYFTTLIGEEDRKKLKRTRCFRILIVKTGVSGGTGKLIIENISLQGTGFAATVTGGNDNGESVTAGEIREFHAASPSASPVESIFTGTPTFFSEGKTQKVLEVIWQNLEAGEGWEVKKYLSGSLDNIYYREMVLYIRTPALSGATPYLNLNLVDYNNKGIKIGFTPPVWTEWQELILDLESREVTVNGNSLTAIVEIDQLHGRLNTLQLSLEGSGSGILYADEIHFKKTHSTLGAAGTLDMNILFPGDIIKIGSFPLLGNISLKESANITTEGFSTLSGIPQSRLLWNSLTNASMELLLTKLDVNLAINGNYPDINFSAGHSIQIPSKAFPVTFKDYFNFAEDAEDPGISRENQLNIAIGSENSLGINLSTGAHVKKGSQTQNWALKLNGKGGDVFTGAADLSLLSSNNGIDAAPNSYFPAWIESYALILPEATGIQERKSILNVTPTIKVASLSIDLKAMMETRSGDFTPGTKKMDHRLNYSLTLPFEIQASKILKLKFSPGYRRNFTGSTGGVNRGSYLEDAGDYFSGLGNHPYIFLQIPGYEIFSGAAEQDFRSRNNDSINTIYTPELFLNFSKTIGSNIMDLFLPTSLEVAINKNMQKEADLFSFKNHYRLTGRHNAINLFGKYGAYSFFKFYNIDEYSTGYTIDLEAAEQTITGATYSLSNLFNFEGRKDYFFTVENNLNIKDNILQGSPTGRKMVTENRSTFSYQWPYKPDKWIDIPMIEEEVEKSGVFNNKEQVQVVLRDDTSSTSIHPVTITLNHETSLIFPQFGFISARASIGLDHESVTAGADSKNLWRLGLQAAIEGKIQLK